MKITCLIPFYNEGERVLNTLDKLTKIRAISQFICIDDGSTDNISALIQEKYPQIKVIKLASNQGKSEAINQGLRYVKTEYILLFDADLSNIKVEEIENSITKILSNQSIDMIILRRIIESKFLSLIRHDIVMSGQRILKTKDLRKVFTKQFKGYQLEMSINDYMMKKNKKAYWMPLSTSNPKKVFKHGLINSLSFYKDTIKGFISCSGFNGYLKQIATFCKQQTA